jgi:hypothetical protein
MYFFRQFEKARLFATVIIVVGVQSSFGQENSSLRVAEGDRGSSNAVSPEVATVGQTVSYQLRDWKPMHFHDAQEAERYLRTVEQLGCVAKKTQHGGHIDVQYHCQEWKSISLDNPEAAQQWRDWLVTAGFDVFWPRVDATFSNGPEAVQFRQLEYKTIHGDGSAEQSQFVETLKKLGCDVRAIEHNSHADIRYRAPTWTTIRFADQTEAKKWREWLVTQGFETKSEAGN